MKTNTIDPVVDFTVGEGFRNPKVERLPHLKNLLTTPVIYAIIEWTVNPVKLLNNVVVGTGTL